MSLTSITTTCCDPFFCLNPDCETNALERGKRCSVCSRDENIRRSSSKSSKDATLYDEKSTRMNVISIDSSSSTVSHSGGLYGEPLTTQKVTIDFTPVEGEDDDLYVVKKVTDFWDFIEKNPDLKKFCAMPEPSQVKASAVHEEEEEEKEEDSMNSFQEDQALYWINKENIMNNIQLDKALKASPCELPRSNHSSHALSVQKRGRAGAVKLKRNQSEVQKLCKEMKEWDLTHPKSMLPPTDPSLIHAVLQRKPQI